MSLSKQGGSSTPGGAPPGKKRKIDSENRSFQQRWEYEYFFVVVDEKLTCLVCNTVIAVRKEFNLKRHYSTHSEQFKNLSAPQRVAKLEELKEARASSNAKTTSAPNRLMTRSGTALHASFVLSDMLLRRGKPFTDGPFIKECLKTAASIVAPDAVAHFETISLSPNTIADRADDIARDLASQLRRKGATFSHFTLALDESTDLTDTAQLAIFVRGIDEEMNILEGLLDLVPLRETTKGLDIFNALVAVVQKYRLEWDKFVGLATDGCPSVSGDKKDGLVARLRVHLKSLGLPSDFPHVHCIIHQEALCAKSLPADEVMNVVVKAVRWLSRAKVLKVFFDLRDTIKIFLKEKNHPIPELDKPKWVAELAFLVDVTGHLNNLNLKLQGKGHVISDMLQAVQGFEMRLTLFEEQLRKGELFHFESLKSLSSSELDLIKFANIVKKLRIEFADNFKDVRKMQTEISLMTVPFTMPLPKVPLPLQNEVIDLRCDKVLESRFPTMKLVEFCTLLSAERFPQLKGLSRLTDEHLTAQLRVMARNSLQPDFNNLILEKNAQVSPTHSGRFGLKIATKVKNLIFRINGFLCLISVDDT
ncbi:general transcription factor II-I repeat domain-containing protein 2-like [Frankliniella occidentalis]|uniref:General transcription factor II-I repeat domain-containing protein 2-like n=1 Tax=Frankliniella occidentalis TaxID=133901 RepID=A0A6J1T7R9_FRAOC|nr:general transcription factor II-I repeat domain-containing protein 2-like [Frankliniella occidentalis]